MKELIVNIEDNVENILLVDNGILLERYKETDYKKRLEGNIYIGKIKNVIRGLQAAFVDIGEDKNAFIHLKDILPKSNNGNEEYSNEDIGDYIKPEMPILVEVKRDSTSDKGARVSTHINISGRYVVFMPNCNFVTASQKLENEVEKKRLIDIVSKNLDSGTGAIIRTAAENKSEKDIIDDLQNLKQKWEKIINSKVDTNMIPKLVYKTDGLLNKMIVDLIDTGLERIVVNTQESYDYIKIFLDNLGNNNIELVLKKENLLKMYTLEKQMELVENRKIYLDCGGFITIDKTEALTAIDVNSGKYIGKSNLEETVFLVNKQASIEIAKQLRLRDIGGIVIIDFIDMKEEKNKEELISVFKGALRNDRSKVQIEGFTKLNLLELTRKHICSN